MDPQAEQAEQAIVRESGDTVRYPYHRIEVFSGLPSQDIRSWIRNFEYVAKSGKWNDQDKVYRLPLYLSGAAKDWYETAVTS